MTDHDHVSVEFEAIVGSSGMIPVPMDLLKDLKRGQGKVHVRLTKNAIGSGLHERGVDEEEIEHISRMQLEPREQVVKFLLSEGVLSKKARRRSR